MLSPEDAPSLPAAFLNEEPKQAVQQHFHPDLFPTRRSVDPSGLFGLLAPRVDEELADNDDAVVALRLYDEVVGAVLERGRFTKDELVATWGLTPGQYSHLQAICSKRKDIASGPKGVGGLVAKRASARRIEEDVAGEFPMIDLDPWAQVAATRITSLLSQPTLLELVGDLESGIRNARRIESNVDRPSRKAELAVALILQHGVDLFSNTDVRKAVGKALKIDAPSHWHPGKSAAAEFVMASGFPSELVGLPTAESRPDMEYLEGRFKLEPLQPFQNEVKLGLLETLQDPPGRRCIVTLPTGGGKTRVAVESISYWQFDRYDHSAERANRGTVIWFAHTEELCEQACACFRQVWEASDTVAPVTLIRFWGSYTKDLVQKRQALEDAMRGATVIVSTPHRLESLFESRARGADAVLEALRENLGLIVVDEAHRAAAPMYRKLITLLSDSNDPRISVVGLTATPFRMEYLGDDPEKGTRELKEIFQTIREPLKTLGPNPRVALQDMEILAKPIFETIETGTRIRIPGATGEDMLSEDEIERIDRILAIRADNSPRRSAVLKRILEITKEPTASVLYFGPSVRDAECMAYLLRERGVAAAVVSGSTRDVTRRRVVDEFKNNLIRVLCNCEVLTTGFDAPRVTHVVIARPTVSRVLYEQIVGRGLRGPKFKGTATCVVVDCQDEISGPRPPLGYESFRSVWYGTVPMTSRHGQN